MRCTQCEEVITNPVCPHCLSEEMEQWLHEQGAREVVEVVSVFTSGVARRGSVSCILCNRPMHLCTYCYTEEVLCFIKHDERLLSQYLTYFNYDLHHFGWEQEARAYLEGILWTSQSSSDGLRN